MAQSIHVVGATVVAVGGTTIGQTDESNDIEWEVTLGEKKIYTNASGPVMPAKIVNLGMIGKLAVPLISWDDSAIAGIIQRCSGAAAAGQIGTLGVDLTQFSVTLTTQISGELSYAFPKSRLVDNWKVNKFGYEAKRLVLLFEVIPDPTALATATTALYTTTTN